MRTIELLVRTFLTMNISNDHSPNIVNFPPNRTKIFSPSNEFPWYASIQTTNYYTGFPHCSGILIDPSWVLTVAHCVESYKAEQLWVLLGENNLYKDKVKEIYHEIDFFVMHERYLHYRKPFIFDIALVHLKNPAIIGEFVQTINVSDCAHPEVKGQCKDIEFVENKKKNISFLRKTPIIYRDPEICHQNYVNVSVDGQNVCGEKEAIDVDCESDAGTVLYCELSSGNKSVIGLSSWVDSCEKQQKPIIYSRISFHLPWIKKTMKEYELNGNGAIKGITSPRSAEKIPSYEKHTSSNGRKPEELKPSTVETTTSSENTDEDYDYEPTFWGK